MWLTAQELLVLNSMPNTPQGIKYKADLMNWEKRQRVGVKGKVFEYNFKSLPQDVQAEILLKQSKSAVENVDVSVKPKELNYLPEVIWAPFDKATDAQRAKAKKHLTAVIALADLLDNGQKIENALDLVAQECAVKTGSLKRWYYNVRNFQRSDWLPLLLPKYGKRTGKEADFTPEAWEAFKADYFRNEKPQFGACFERLKRAAKEQSWVISSASSIKRKIEREIPKVQRVFLRESEHALSQFYPAMQRSVEDIEALEWINGDGYQHNVFVKWHETPYSNVKK